LQAKDVLLCGLLPSRFAAAEACNRPVRSLWKRYSAGCDPAWQVSNTVLRGVPEAAKAKEADSFPHLHCVRKGFCSVQELKIL
jgi:hypothetical protein